MLLIMMFECARRNVSISSMFDFLENLQHCQSLAEYPLCDLWEENKQNPIAYLRLYDLGK